MPVQRFRSLDDARRALWCERAGPALYRRIARLWAAGVRLAPLGIPRGLRKFRTIEEANREREQWVAERVRALAAARNARPRSVG